MKCSAVQCCAVLCSAVQCSAVQCSVVKKIAGRVPLSFGFNVRVGTFRALSGCSDPYFYFRSWWPVGSAVG